VRASARDAFSLNGHVVLAEEPRFDHGKASQAVSLCDMHAKYVAVMSLADVLS
jgi:maleamate amidohydrolase